MRIGIVFNIDKETLLSCFPLQTDKVEFSNHCVSYGAPAVNTLIHSFLQAGHFVRIFTLAQRSFTIITDQIEIYATEVYNRYPIKYLWGTFTDAHALRKLMQEHLNDLDVLHAHWTYQNAYAALFYEKQIPVFCTVRDIASYIWWIESVKNKVTWSFRVLMNWMVFRHKKKIHFIANSPYTAAIIKKKYHIDVPIIPNSIKDSFIKHDNHLSPKAFKILCISSSNDKRKNVKALLYAFKTFRFRHPEATLQLVGNPFVDGDTIIENWKYEGLLQQVELIGGIPHDKLVEYIDRCSIFVTPSLEETFGNTLLESIVRKVPVIGGLHSGAVPYVLHHGEAGYLCDVSKPECICQALEYVYSHPQEVANKAEEAYQIILSEYTEDIVCQKHIELYKKYIIKA